MATIFHLPRICIEPVGLPKNLAENRIVSIFSSFQKLILNLLKNALTLNIYIVAIKALSNFSEIVNALFKH